jgi:hypothetical protein
MAYCLARRGGLAVGQLEGFVELANYRTRSIDLGALGHARSEQDGVAASLRFTIDANGSKPVHTMDLGGRLVLGVLPSEPVARSKDFAGKLV